MQFVLVCLLLFQVFSQTSLHRVANRVGNAIFAARCFVESPTVVSFGSVFKRSLERSAGLALFKAFTGRPRNVF